MTFTLQDQAIPPFSTPLPFTGLSWGQAIPPSPFGGWCGGGSTPLPFPQPPWGHTMPPFPSGAGPHTPHPPGPLAKSHPLSPAEPSCGPLPPKGQAIPLLLWAWFQVGCPSSLSIWLDDAHHAGPSAGLRPLAVPDLAPTDGQGTPHPACWEKRLSTTDREYFQGSIEEWVPNGSRVRESCF